ncbi:helix-turn-helix domain-containing protein, partial [Streptomyces sp. NPDC001215]
MIRAYKFLIRPTVGQEQALSAMLRHHCTLYNAALQERRDAYRHVSKTTVRYGQQSAQLKEIRAGVQPALARSWLTRSSTAAAVEVA